MYYKTTKNYRFTDQETGLTVSRITEGTDVGGPKIEGFRIYSPSDLSRTEVTKLLSLLEWALNDK